MALQARKLFLDVQGREFVTSPDSSLPSIEPIYFNEDVEVIEIYALSPTQNPVAPYSYADISGASVKFAVGAVSPAALQTSWTAVNTAVTASVTTVVTGGVNISHQQKITLTGAVPVEGGFAIEFPQRSVSVTAVSAGTFTASRHGFCDGQIIALSGFTVSGGSFSNTSYYVVGSGDDTFQIANSFAGTAINAQVTSGGGTATIGPVVTGQIAYNAEPSTVQTALLNAGFNVAGICPISVTGIARSYYVLTYGSRMSGRAYSEINIVGNTLAGAIGLTANVSFNTVEVAALIAAGTTNVTMEIEISEGAVRQTFRRNAILSDDLITSTSPLPAPTGFSTSFTLQSPNGNLWTISMSNDGNLEWTLIP